MTNTYLNIVAQYVRESRMTTSQRPYSITGALHSELDIYLDCRLLPEAGHGLALLRVEALMKTSSGEVAMQAVHEIEGIAVSKGLSPEELMEALRFNVAAALFGAARTGMHFLSLSTGYPPIILPPISADRLQRLPPFPETYSR